MYRVGQYFQTDFGPSILAQVDISKVCLISLDSANRNVDAVSVQDIYLITEEEMKQISGSSPYQKIEKAFTVNA